MKNIYAETLLTELKEGSMLPAPTSYEFKSPQHITIEISLNEWLVVVKYIIIVNGVRIEEYYPRSNRVSLERANEIKNDGVVRYGKAHTRVLERLKSRVLDVINNGE